MDLLMVQAPWQDLGKSVFRPPYDQNIRALKYFFTIQYSMAYSIQFSIYSVICRKFSMFSYGPRESKTFSTQAKGPDWDFFISKKCIFNTTGCFWHNLL